MAWQTNPADFADARGFRELLLELSLRRGALRRELRESLRTAIQDGRLAPNLRLPSSRRLAGDLGVSRGVVSDAYDQLVSEGYLEVRARSAPVVAAISAAPQPDPEPTEPDWSFDLISTTPDVSMFPRRSWLRAMEKALRTTPDAALAYGDRRGRRELRFALSAYVARVRGVRIDASRIVVTQGFTQGLHLVCRTIVARGGSRVALETPSLPEFWTTVRDAGVELVGCQVDSRGVRPDSLARLQADAIVVTPAHQYPVGGVLEPGRRQALLRWAAERHAIIVEDDYDAEFRYDRTPVGAIQGLDPAHVIHAGTTSKSLAPGLRLGWLSLPPDFVAEVRTHKLASDSGSPAIDQLAFAELLVSGEYERHIARLRLVYRRRRDLLLRAVAERRPDLRLLGAAAGTHLVMPLPPDIDDSAIAAAARARGFRIRSLSSHHLVPSPERGLVIGYGRLPDHRIEPALDVLLPLVPRLARSH